MEAVKQNGGALGHASGELKSDREGVMEAVPQNGCALEFASEERKPDREAVAGGRQAELWCVSIPEHRCALKS